MASKEDMKLFINEADEYINRVEQEILNLEERPGNNKPIQELYFIFHTLKGLTAMVGLDNVSKFCHNFETLLDRTKDMKISKKRSEEIVNLMFESLDVLRSVLRNAKEGDLKDITSRVVTELQESFEEVESDYQITFIHQIQLGKIDSVITKKENKFYSIKVWIKSTCVFKKVRLFIIFRALNNIGKICWSKPDPNVLEAGDIDLEFEVYYISDKKATEITKVLDEILEIENKVVKSMKPNEFKKVLTIASSKWQKQEKIREEPLKIQEYTEEDIEIAPERDSVSTIVQEFEQDTGQITSVRVNIETLEELMDYFGEVIILKNQLSQILSERGDWGVTRFFDSMDKLFLEIQNIIFKLKLVKVDSAFRRYKRLVRDVSKGTNKNIKFSLEGTDVELDRKILEELNSPIIHLLRNAIYHGIESPSERRAKGKSGMGNLKLKTTRRAGSIDIEVIDDGKGIDYDKIREKIVQNGQFTPEEAIELTKEELNKVIFTPGFSTLTNADMISGRGMGLAIVTGKLKEIGGSIEVQSERDRGTTLTLTVPFSRAILKAQLFKVAGDLYAIPIENIEQIYFFKKELIEYVKGEEYYRIGSSLIPVVRLNHYLDVLIHYVEEMEEQKLEEINEAKEEEKLEEIKGEIQEFRKDSRDRIAILCNKDEKNSVIFVVDEILHQMDVVIKPFRSRYSDFNEILGVSITGDGSICLIIDVVNIISTMTKDLKVLESIETAK